MSTWEDKFINNNLPTRSQNTSPDLSAIDAIMTRVENNLLPKAYSFNHGEKARVFVEDKIAGTFTQEIYVCVEMSDKTKHWEFKEVQS